MSRLSAAFLRIGTSLDVEAVLREVVDSARALTGARYGVIVSVDGGGRPKEFVISGFPADQEQRLATWPDAMRLFEHFGSLDGPLRVDDLPQYVRSLGFSDELMLVKTFQCMPMRHRGECVGTFFLAGKEDDGKFTDADNEVLTLFAAQAAIAIANARTHREEQRARADLEALVETSPVGVLVLDASTGIPLLLNREAKRILAGLLDPDCSLEKLREVLTSRLADGREVTLEGLKSGETIRAAEIELSVPDGRSVRVLVNATPIRSANGEVESVMVSMQDLAPLENLERLQAEFLGMVSHELSAPLAAILGSAVTLLEDAHELDTAERRQFHRIIVEQAGHMRHLIGDLLDAGRIDAGKLEIEPGPCEVAMLIERARAVFQNGDGRHAMRFDLPSDLPRVMADERRILQVLGNLLSNAARHSPESSPIHVDAVRDRFEVAISISDQGRGIPPERLPHLFRKYVDIGGRNQARDAAGFGLGLVICKGIVEAHGGRIRAESAGRGLGARFTFTLPVAEEPAAAAVAGSAPPVPMATHEEASVLVVDDDPEALRQIRNALVAAGFAPLVTSDPPEALQLVRTKRPKLVLLDLVLPGTDGIELMQEMADTTNLPVIFISAYSRDEIVVRALEAGAADYIVKPFSSAELIARVRATLRRNVRTEPFLFGDLSIDYEQRQVTVAGRLVRLTRTEYELLRVLSINAGRVVTYASLLHQVWTNSKTYSEYGDSEPVRGAVKRLRRKLGEDPATPVWIFNERGVGYRMPRPGES